MNGAQHQAQFELAQQRRRVEAFQEYLPMGSRMLLVTGVGYPNQMAYESAMIVVDALMTPARIQRNGQLVVGCQRTKVLRSTFVRRMLLVAPDGKCHVSALVPEDVQLPGVPSDTLLGAFLRQGDSFHVKQLVIG